MTDAEYSELTVGDLRRALEGVPDNIPVVIPNWQWSCYTIPETAALVHIPWKDDIGPMLGPKESLPKVARFLISSGVDIWSHSDEAAS